MSEVILNHSSSCEDSPSDATVSDRDQTYAKEKQKVSDPEKLHACKIPREESTSETRSTEVATEDHSVSCSGSVRNDSDESIIIQSSADSSLGGLDPSLLKYVREALTIADGQHSFMIVNHDGDCAEEGSEQTTYIIDLNPHQKQNETVASTIGQSTSTDSQHDDSSLLLVNPSTASSSSPALESSTLGVTSGAKVFTTDIGDLHSSAQGDLVKIYVTSPAQHDLNNPIIVSEVSIQTQPQLVSTHPMGVSVTEIAPKNLSDTTSSQIQKSTSSFFHPHNSTGVHTTGISSVPSSTGIETELSTQGSIKESHKSAEYLLHMAKKMIEEKAHNKKMVSGHSSSLSVTPPEVEIEEEKSSSESVITMYLSSPSELKEKIEKLKTNSPVIVMQAGDDLLEEKVNIKSRHNAGDNSSKAGPLIVKSENSSSSSEAFGPSDSVIVGYIYKCSECGYSSHNKHYYKQHVDLVHNTDRPYKCPLCDYAGKRRHALLEHMVVHSNQRPFTCDHCNASFRKKGHLTNHIKLHTSQRLVHCGVCKIQLPDTEAFEAHLRKIHNTDKLYKCRLCDHTVVDREAMLRHLYAHDESVVYSCPKCPNLFNDEENLISHMKYVHDIINVEGSMMKVIQDNTGTKSSGNEDKPPTTNLICSECGFVCGKPEVMQKHMWAHIGQGDKQNVSKHDKIKISPGNKEESNSSTMGVLKMNVDLGQKTLPKNVVYQCASCSFTSSDNSVFIKHMLAHKTQEKRQRFGLPEKSNDSDDHQSLNEQPSTSSTQPTPRSISYYTEAGQKVDSKPKADTGVPFVYDKASARFRCVICGYHCEFQRTIKAHIWKHSGHQSIEYPTFDRPSRPKASAGTSAIHIVASKGFPKETDQMPVGKDKVIVTSSGTSKQQNLPVFKTPSGDMVQLVPVNPLKTRYKPGEILQIKDNAIIVPADHGNSSAASRILESIAFSNTYTDSRKAKLTDNTTLVSSTSTTSTVRSVKDDGDTVTADKKIKSEQREGPDTEEVSSDIKIKLEEGEDFHSNSDTDEKCTEPSVVVEVMDTVPSGSGFTGMKSQQGSPRVLDLDGSSGDGKLVKAFQEVRQRKGSTDSDGNLSENEKSGSDKTSGRTVQVSDPSKNHHSYSARLRCPICDCLLMEDFKTHLLNCQKKIGEESIKIQKQGKITANKKHTSLIYKHDDAENPQTEDTDSTESLEDSSLPDSVAGQQKHGICSSLLAVIEQLRERSRSESEDDKQGMSSSKKGGKKRTRQDEEDDLESVDDLQNIEKVSENGSEKFRCSLCHYSSHRICNIKLHMKTHRQKKPSECSLCDFSSTSPEALQEHMLKHCKVRTYACKFCPQSFNHKSTLRAHLRAHKDQEPFLCAYCVFETTNPMEYREHMQVHSGCSSRLRCPGCDTILGNKDELTTHLLKCKGSTKKVHSAMKSVEKTEEATDDEKVKVEDEQLSDSVTMHACVVSGCCFSSSSLKELQEHLSIHCNPSLLVCNLCDFKALHSRSLKSHMKRHANDQRYVQQPLEQYKCNLCGYVCHHLPSLKSHMWRHASDQSYSYEFTNDVINAAIDHDTRVDADGEADDPELLDRVINSERKILEGELTKCSKGDGQRPICWVTFRCCSCGFETINKAKLNIHMRTHSDIIQKALDIPRKSVNVQNKTILSTLPASKSAAKRSNVMEDTSLCVPVKVLKTEEAG